MIIGAKTTGQLKDNLASINVKLDDGDLKELDAVSRPTPSIRRGCLSATTASRDRRGSGQFQVAAKAASCFGPTVIIVEMVQKTIAAAALMAAYLLTGCGTSTLGPDGGSKAETETGVSPSGYPAGQPKDANSPALASSTEQQYSRGQAGKD